MDILPALDIANGRALTHRGADGCEGSTSANPLEVARSFVAQGASWIHLVDIDAAFERGSNSDVLSEVISELHGSGASVSGRHAPECRIELSGGVRTGEDIEAALQAGADRVNLASQALVDIDQVSSLIAEFAGRLNICIDVEGDRIRPRGVDGDAGNLWEVCRILDQAGVRRYIVTERQRDGALMGPPVDLLRDLRAKTPTLLVASGGIRHIEDIHTLRREGYLDGVIVGKALYVGSLTLGEALSASQSVS